MKYVKHLKESDVLFFLVVNDLILKYKQGNIMPKKRRADVSVSNFIY